MTLSWVLRSCYGLSCTEFFWLKFTCAKYCVVFTHRSTMPTRRQEGWTRKSRPCIRQLGSLRCTPEVKNTAPDGYKRLGPQEARGNTSETGGQERSTQVTLLGKLRVTAKVVGRCVIHFPTCTPRPFGKRKDLCSGCYGPHASLLARGAALGGRAGGWGRCRLLAKMPLSNGKVDERKRRRRKGGEGGMMGLGNSRSCEFGT